MGPRADFVLLSARILINNLNEVINVSDKNHLCIVALRKYWLFSKIPGSEINLTNLRFSGVH